jgi:hypothetical protein
VWTAAFFANRLLLVFARDPPIVYSRGDQIQPGITERTNDVFGKTSFSREQNVLSRRIVSIGALNRRQSALTMSVTARCNKTLVTIKAVGYDLQKRRRSLSAACSRNGWNVKIKACCANVTRDAACASSTSDVERSTEFYSISAAARCYAA